MAEDTTTVDTTATSTEGSNTQAGTTDTNSSKWYDQEGIGEYVNDKVKGFTADDGSMDVKGLLKSYANAQSMIGSSVKIPTENSSPEEVASFYSKMGRPEAADKYTWDTPEGMNIASEPFKAFAENAFNHNLTQAQYKGVLDGYTKIYKDMESQRQQFLVDQEKNTTAELKKEWGDSYDSKMKAVMNLVDKAGIKDKLAFSGFLNDKDFIKLFNSVTESSSSTNLKGGISDSSKEARISELRKDAAYLNAGHPNHSKVVAEYNALLDS